jgi:hypothetical protein
MKKMNNYVAPKAEMIELNVNKDVMQTASGQQWTETSPTGF